MFYYYLTLKSLHYFEKKKRIIHLTFICFSSDICMYISIWAIRSVAFLHKTKNNEDKDSSQRNVPRTIIICQAQDRQPTAAMRKLTDPERWGIIIARIDSISVSLRLWPYLNWRGYNLIPTTDRVKHECCGVTPTDDLVAIRNLEWIERAGTEWN